MDLIHVQSHFHIAFATIFTLSSSVVWQQQQQGVIEDLTTEENHERELDRLPRDLVMEDICNGLGELDHDDDKNVDSSAGAIFLDRVSSTKHRET